MTRAQARSLKPGDVILTPSGRRAKVLGHRNDLIDMWRCKAASEIVDYEMLEDSGSWLAGSVNWTNVCALNAWGIEG